MPGLIVCVGGLHDGAEIRTRRIDPFLWFDGRRAYRAPGGERVLYQRGYRVQVAPGDVGVAYLYVGHLTVQCSCGAFRVKSDPCPVCGSTEAG